MLTYSFINNLDVRVLILLTLILLLWKTTFESFSFIVTAILQATFKMLKQNNVETERESRKSDAGWHKINRVQHNCICFSFFSPLAFHKWHSPDARSPCHFKCLGSIFYWLLCILYFIHVALFNLSLSSRLSSHTHLPLSPLFLLRISCICYIISGKSIE